MDEVPELQDLPNVFFCNGRGFRFWEALFDKLDLSGDQEIEYSPWAPVICVVWLFVLVVWFSQVILCYIVVLMVF